MIRTKPMEEHRAEIIEYLENNPNRDMSKIIINNVYQKKKILKSGKRKGSIQYIWWANITCEKNHLPFDIRKTDLIISDHWCKKCSSLKKMKTYEEVKTEILEYLKNDLERDLNKLKIHRIYSKEYITQSGKRKGAKQYIWWVNITCEKNHSSINIRKNDIIAGHWCPKCGILKKSRTHEDVEAEIWEYLKDNQDRDLNKITIHKVYQDVHTNKSGKEKIYWYIDILCEKNHLFKIKTRDISIGNWCKKCADESLLKTHEAVEAEIWEYIRKNPNRDLQRIIIHKIFRKDFIIQNGKNKGKIQKLWTARITCEGVKINGKIEKHTFEMRKGNLADKRWCPICQSRIIAIGNYSHTIIEYFSLKTLIELRKCNAKHEVIIEEGTRPDLIIPWNYAFKKEIFSYLILSLININEIAVDFTMSRKNYVILRKCKKHYQNDNRFLLIVLMWINKEGGNFTAKKCQEEVENDDEIDNKDKKLIKIINYEQYLKFLGLGKEKEKKEFFDLNEEEQNILKQEKKLRRIFLKTKELAIEAIKSSDAMYKLIYKSNKYKKMLRKEFLSKCD